MPKEAMDLRESKKGYMGEGIWKRKTEGKML